MPLTTQEKLDKAHNVLNHIVRRHMTDPDFHWHFAGTQSLALATDAIAACEGEDANALRERVEANTNFRGRRVQLHVLRERIAKLKRLHGHAYDYRHEDGDLAKVEAVEGDDE